MFCRIITIFFPHKVTKTRYASSYRMYCTLLIWTSTSAVSLLEVICTISTRSAGNVVSGRNMLQIHWPYSPTVPVTFPEPHCSDGCEKKGKNKMIEFACLSLSQELVLKKMPTSQPYVEPVKKRSRRM